MKLQEIKHTEYQDRVKSLDDASLAYIIKDCREALEAMPTSPKAGYYLDELHYCTMEQRLRAAAPSQVLPGEQAEGLGQDLMTVAATLAVTIAQVDDLAKQGVKAVSDEMGAYETIVLQGQDVVYALRAMAKRFDRCAVKRS